MNHKSERRAQRRANSRRGVAALIALVCLSLATIIGTLLLQAALAEQRYFERLELESQGEWLVEAGFSRARASWPGPKNTPARRGRSPARSSAGHRLQPYASPSVPTPPTRHSATSTSKRPSTRPDSRRSKRRASSHLVEFNFVRPR